MAEFYPKHVNGVEGSNIRITDNRNGESQSGEVYIRISNGKGWSAFTGLDPNETYEVIELMARIAGLKSYSGSSGDFVLKKPAPRKSPEELRREELNMMHTQSLMDLIVDLEKEAGKL